MTKLEIKAADLLLEYGNPNKSIKVDYCINVKMVPYMTKEILITASLYLKEYGFVELSDLGVNKMYTLTTSGYDYYRSGKRIGDYLQEQSDKEAKRIAKEEQDEHHKNLQIRDLDEKLNIMNVEQRDFWKAQKQKNVQTTLIAIISAVFSFIALLKAFGYL